MLDDEDTSIKVDQKQNKEEQNKELAGGNMLFKLPLFAGLTWFNIVSEGYILSKMWLWFILSKFPSLPTLTCVNAIGIIWIVNFILNDLRNITYATFEMILPQNINILSYKITKKMFDIFVKNPTILLFAWAWWKYMILKHV